ncbi:MAG: N-6 DNA methylase, partial [Methanophagales archaeon]|nr:N-6 DNA methylase [Methanophagales archaeon]
VYYTPQYIVDYIVKNTVGKLVAGKTPEEIAEIKILDPACGSGSFLIGAYTYLLRYHLDWYTSNEPKKHKEAVFQVRENEWYLTTVEKKRILLNNIFGVDIDPQAVEVTKLSLLLKVLEHESRESIDQQVKLGLEGVLPNLAGNIKCGNSLIGPDFYGTGQATLFDEEEMRRVNVFDWNDNVKGFGRIMKRGGFDVVVGNPPYVEFKRLDAGIKKPIRERFESAKGKFDLFIPFIEQGIRILKEGGCISYICPSMFVKRDFGEGIRRFITNNAQIVKLTHFSDFQIFGKVTNYPIIFVFQKSKNIEKTKIELFTKTRGLTHAIVEKTLQENKNTPFFKTYSVSSNNFSDEAWDFSTEDCKALRAKLETTDKSKRLGELCKYIFEGIASGKDEVFYINSDVIAQFKLENDIIYPIYRGENIGRYFSRWSDTWVIYPYDRETNEVIPERDLKEKYPNVYRYLQGKRDNLRGRKYFDKSNKKWYELWCERAYKKFKPSKIIVAEISPENRFCLDTEGFLGNTKTFNLVLEDNQTMDYKYLLGILNSKLMNFYHRLVSVPKAGGYFEYKTQFLSLYPIRTIDFSIPAEKAQHDKLVALVDNMLKLQKKHHGARMERDKELYEWQIKIVDAQIDKLVCELYGLTEEEIEIMEESL